MSYSSAGEDMIIRHLLGNLAGAGTYVDVGAWHPTIASNTYHFYRIGWNGVSIEPQDEMVRLHRRIRPLDKTVSCVISTIEGEAELRIPRAGSSMAGLEPRYFGDEVELRIVPSMRLERALGNSLETNEIGFMTVDVEGAELDVLQSNDWDRFRPKVICVETGSSVDEVADFLNDHGYFVAATNSIIIDEVREIFMVDSRVDWRATLT